MTPPTLDELLDGANPAFALTVRMRSCRWNFHFKVAFFVFFATASIVLPFVPKDFIPGINLPALSPSETFELTFLTAACFSLTFLSSDFGVVFIESTFEDELFRLTPMTPLDIVHGGMMTSLFFSVLLLFVTGQALCAVLLSSYISAKNWRQIGFGFGAGMMLLLSFVGFCFTRLGSLLADTEKWPLPMVFLFGVVAVLFGTAYVLARSHATAKRSFRKTICVNLGVYGVLWTVVCLLAVHLV